MPPDSEDYLTDGNLCLVPSLLLLVLQPDPSALKLVWSLIDPGDPFLLNLSHAILHHHWQIVGVPFEFM